MNGVNAVFFAIQIENAFHFNSITVKIHVVTHDLDFLSIPVATGDFSKSLNFFKLLIMLITDAMNSPKN